MSCKNNAIERIISINEIESTTIEVTSETTTYEVNETEQSETEAIEIKPYNYDDILKPSADFKKVSKREKKDVFCFVGDVYLSERPRNAYDLNGLDGIVDKGYQRLLSSSDFNIANLECSMTDDTENDIADKTFTFALPTKYVSALKEVGINLFTLANNHILDYGINSMLNTINVLDENGIYHIGAGKNLDSAKEVYIKEIDGKRYAFFSASGVLPAEDWKATNDRAGVFSGYELSSLCREIKLVKEYVDKVIVYMHWGRELEPISSSWQKYYGRRMIDAGADLVVGAHPHITQEIEFYNNVPIVYSLGNFIYGGTMRETMLLTATFDYSEDENGKLSIRIYPGVSNYSQVKKYWDKDVITYWVKRLEAISTNCFIDEEGNALAIDKSIIPYVMTDEISLKDLATSSEIN